MTLFWILAIGSLLVALAILAPTLLRRPVSEADYTTEIDISIARERMAEVVREYEKGELSEEEFSQAKRDLEIALAQDIGGKETIEPLRGQSEKSSRLALLAIVITLPALTLGLYQHLGSPELISPANADQQASSNQKSHGSNAPDGMPSVEEMVAKLEAKLASEPENTEGWFMLGRTYMALNNYAGAVRAYEKLNTQIPNDPKIMLPLADATAMVNGGRLRGRPAELVLAALKMVPNNPTALWLAGSASSEVGDSEAAIGYWQRAKIVLISQPGLQSELTNLIAGEQQKLGHPVAKALPLIEPAPMAPVSQATAPGLTVHVALAPELADKVSGEDTVFIYAKATSGPPMPLAVSRQRVKDLPITVTLDDSMAMMPQLKLSNFDQVNVGARVSKSGQPIAQPGDWQSELQIAKTNASDRVTLVINQLKK